MFAKRSFTVVSEKETVVVGKDTFVCTNTVRWNNHKNCFTEVEIVQLGKDYGVCVYTARSGFVGVVRIQYHVISAKKGSTRFYGRKNKLYTFQEKRSPKFKELLKRLTPHVAVHYDASVKENGELKDFLDSTLYRFTQVERDDIHKAVDIIRKTMETAVIRHWTVALDILSEEYGIS